MKILHCSVKKVGIASKELTDGSYRVTGSFSLRGVVDSELARVLEIEALKDLEQVDDFHVSRESETVAIEMTSLKGSEVLCMVTAATLHAWKIRRVDGDLVVTISGSTDLDGAQMMADFLGRHPSWCGTVTLEPAQRELFPKAA